MALNIYALAVISYGTNHTQIECVTLLEERFISSYIPFMQIRNVANVPADVSSTVTALPRPIHESQTIPITIPTEMTLKSQASL